MTPPSLPLRAAARAIDAAVVALALIGAGAVAGYGVGWLVLGAFAAWAGFALPLAAFGATPGKRVLGLRVVGPDGGPPKVGQVFLREAFTVVGAVPFVGPLLALGAWIAIVVTVRGSPEGQGLHDRLAGGTRVIRG